jgi:Protein of unknown function (DUF3455)
VRLLSVVAASLALHTAYMAREVIQTGDRTHMKILNTASVTVIGMAFSFVLPHIAHAQTVTPPVVPAGLEVTAPDVPFLVGHATGTQNYVCQPSESLGRVDWTLFTPEATLFDEQDEQLITHFFSPNPAEVGVVVRATWQASDTSFVWAKAVASATVDPTAIAWVKLIAVGTQVGPTGGDTLANTTFVQRVNTEGGLAPTTGCDRLNDVGRKAFMPYKADYFFYRKN